MKIESQNPKPSVSRSKKHESKQPRLTRQGYDRFEAGFLDLQRGLQKLEDTEVTAFVERFARLRKEFEPVQAATLAKKQAAARKEAPDFNIFRILGVEHLEDNTHSPFLAQLLDPKGSHGQGDLFLKGFLDLFRDESFEGFPLPELEQGSDGWRINREQSIGNGYLDIVLRNDRLGCLYVIENKIDAPEQPKQLKRYQRWLKTQQSYPKRALIFLTKTGRQPATGTAFCLSYQQDIEYWLGSVIEEIEAARVRETVGQYMAIIAASKEEAMGYEDKVLEFIGHPENVGVALEIASYVEKLKTRAHKQFWSLFNDGIDERYQASVYRNSWDFLKKSLKNFDKGWAGCQLEQKTALASGQTYRLRFAFQQFPMNHKKGFYYGIRWMGPGEGAEGLFSAELDTLMEQLREQQVQAYLPNWPAWVTPDFWPLGENFLVKMTHEPVKFAKGLAEDFWEMFEANVTAVEDVNGAAARITTE